VAKASTKKGLKTTLDFLSVDLLTRDQPAGMLLALSRLPFKIIRWVLNCQPKAVLVAARLLKLWSSPPPNSVKSFATLHLKELF
jgi:hypothetical protein